MDEMDKEALKSNYKGVDKLDREALDIKWFTKEYQGFDSNEPEEKCFYCGNSFNDPQALHLTCGL